MFAKFLCDGQISPTYLKSACPNSVQSVKKFRHMIFRLKCIAA